MHLQVGIAADRRREMGISLQRQPEMTGIAWVVDRLSQGTQHHRLDQMGVSPIANLNQQPGIVQRRGFVAATQPQPHLP